MLQRPGELHRYWTTRDRATNVRLYRLAAEVLAAVDAGVFPPRVSRHCQDCPVRAGAKRGVRFRLSALYLGRRSKPPSQTWRTFLDNHLQTLVSVDFFVVPTMLFNVLFVFVVLAHERRRVVHVNVTDAPTAQWTGQQLVEAFPWDTAPRYLLRDRDAVYGVAFSRRAQSMEIHEVKTAARSPLQNPYVERLIGTLRRECLDHVVALNETHLVAC
jgi:hypothetical protein